MDGSFYYPLSAYPLQLQLQDLQWLLESTAAMDMAYLENWAARLGVGPKLQELLR